MNRFPITLTTILVVLLTSATAHAQHHHFPSVAGKYETSSADMCLVAQDADVIFVSSKIPGVSTFQYVGKFGMGEQVNDLGDAVRRMGFYGSYRLTFDDGRPAKEGAAGMFHNYQTGNMEVRYSQQQGQQWKVVGVAVLERVAQGERPQQPKLSDSNDEFDLLPVEDLKSLGL